MNVFPDWHNEQHWGFQLMDEALARLGQPRVVDNPVFERHNELSEFFPVYFVADELRFPLSLTLAPLQIDIDRWPEVVVADESIRHLSAQIVDDIVKVLTSRCVMRHGHLLHTLDLFLPESPEDYWARHIGLHALGKRQTTRVCGPLFGA